MRNPDRIRCPPPEALKRTAISFPSEGREGHRQRAIAVKRALVIGTFSFTAILRAPRSESVFSWLETVNHKGFWSNPSITNSPSGSSVACKKRTRNTLRRSAVVGGGRRGSAEDVGFCLFYLFGSAPFLALRDRPRRESQKGKKKNYTRPVLSLCSLSVAPPPSSRPLALALAPDLATPAARESQKR